jgi:hypothetical protein
MVKALELMIEEKIQKDELLIVGIEYKCSDMMGDTTIADYDFSKGIYIVGDTLRIDISNEQEFTIEHDELENEFIIKQGDTIFYLS